MAGSYSARSAFMAPLHWPTLPPPRTVWLYLRFTLSCRDVEELLAERGIETSYESSGAWS
jgi:putative transposase